MGAQTFWSKTRQWLRMKYVKQFFTALKKLGLPIHPGLIALIMLAIVLIVLYLRHRSKIRNTADADKQKTPVPSSPPPVSPNLFLQIWRRFKVELPAIVRRSLGQFQPVVVLGAKASGKTQLINRNTDWQRQARYLFGRQLEDPNLQIYLGSRVLVFEMSAPVLTSTARGMREALLNLWRRLFRHRTPLAVVAARPTELAKMSSEEVRAIADAIRGKINLLSQVRGQPIETRVVFSYMDDFEGFLELGHLIQKSPDKSLEIRISPGHLNEDTAQYFMNQLATLENLRQPALETLNAESYLKVLRFLRKASESLSPGATFLNHLMVDEPHSHLPKLSQVFLCSAELNESISEPFRVQANPQDQLQNPLAFHRLAATALVLLVVLGLSFSFFRSRAAWLQAKDALALYPNVDHRHQPEDEAIQRGAISTFIHQTDLLPFYWKAKRISTKTLAQFIHDKVIMRELEGTLAQPRAARRAIYLAALSKLARTQSFRQVFTDEQTLEHWSRVTQLRSDILVDFQYVAPYLGKPSTPDIDIPSAHWVQQDFNSSVITFFEELTARTHKGPALAAEIEQIQLSARQLHNTLSEIENAPKVSRLVTSIRSPELKEKLKPYLIELQSAELDSSKKRHKLLELTRYISESRSYKSPSSPKDYFELCRWLESAFSSRPSSAESELGVTVGEHTFSKNDWRKFTRNTLVAQAVTDFLRQTSQQGNIFFHPAIDYPAMRMNPQTRGSFLFSGRSRIPGRYTRLALQERVVPTLKCHTRAQKRLAKIAPKAARELDTLLDREIESYGKTYIHELTNYYQAFYIETRHSVENLRVVFKQILKGSSPFTHHLTTVANNAQFASPSYSVEQLSTLSEGLSPFVSLGEIVTSTVSGAPPFESYLLIIRQMAETLNSSQDGPESDPGADVAIDDKLRERLGPAGRMALDILTCAPESPYTSVVQWLEEVEMPRNLRRIFLTPVRETFLVGRTEISRTLEDIRRFDIVETLAPLLLKFPFENNSDHDALPEELTALLHPVTGSINRLRRHLIDPLFVRPPGCRPPYSAPSLPGQLKELLQSIQVLGAALWDENGQNQPLTFPFEPVPFNSEVRDIKNRATPAQLTLTFVSSGKSTQVNFNQRPFARNLPENWAKVHNAQVGVKLTRTDNGEDIYPDPLVESSHWALLRLLTRAQRENNLYSWTLSYREPGTQGHIYTVRTKVTFELDRDPFQLFRLRELTTLHRQQTALTELNP